MPKIVFSFLGTGVSNFKHADFFISNNAFHEDVIVVQVLGCQHKNVGGGSYFPDLSIAADKIRKAFSKDQSIDLNILEKELGDAVLISNRPSEAVVSIESIGLHGYSRGGVSTFATAKALNDLDIPIDVIADQPVPGQGSEKMPYSLYQKYSDLRDCQNIRSANVLLGTYNQEQGVLQSAFFQQMVPQFHAETQTANLLMPRHGHFDRNDNSYWINAMTINQAFMDQGYSNKMPTEEDKSNDVMKQSSYQDGKCYFTPREFAQPIYGAEKVKIEIDPSYVAAMKNEAEFQLGGKANMTLSQARAIVALGRIDSLEDKKQLQEFILKDTPEAKKFVKIVNKTRDTLDYLQDVTLGKDKKGNPDNQKSDLIKEHSTQFSTSIIQESYRYLTKKNPQENDKKAFVTGVNQAEKTFIAEATSVDRGLARRILKVAVNTALHITGLFVFANTYHKAKTGDWLLFNDTRSTRIIKDSLHEIKDIMREKIEPNQESVQKEDSETEASNPPSYRHS